MQGHYANNASWEYPVVWIVTTILTVSLVSWDFISSLQMHLAHNVSHHAQRVMLVAVLLVSWGTF